MPCAVHRHRPWWSEQQTHQVKAGLPQSAGGCLGAGQSPGTSAGSAVVAAGRHTRIRRWRVQQSPSILAAAVRSLRGGCRDARLDARITGVSADLAPWRASAADPARRAGPGAVGDNHRRAALLAAAWLKASAAQHNGYPTLIAGKQHDASPPRTTATSARPRMASPLDHHTHGIKPAALCCLYTLAKRY